MTAGIRLFGLSLCKVVAVTVYHLPEQGGSVVPYNEQQTRALTDGAIATRIVTELQSKTPPLYFYI